MEFVLGIILLVAAVFLVVAVLMQSGKSHNLSGTIAGGAETFFGKTKGKTIDKMLSKITTVVAIIFALLVIVVYIIQPETGVDYNKWLNNYLTTDTTAAETTISADTSSSADTTAASETTADTALITEAING
jgi:preprotein translocase subunit SecG